jgi:hypothetical protein
MILMALCLCWAFSASAGEVKHSKPEAALEGIGAREAIDLANQWRWTRKDITSYVTSHELFFEFPSGEMAMITLPKNEMLVSMAPYMTYTHR